ncbi:hypothetical protein CERSUDRAFT_96170 [Gelatoporia subvermispora B]|uniref:DUF6533 domain-containing protein n=1 Tax=Ceriporiopsis subvermispora (strain B) TaxID=914234 RepID=M2PIH8_CERS8|nr:hypothetical protein CERSUDRAFT_96170 [Gelatoporia subvermispora B]
MAPLTSFELLSAELAQNPTTDYCQLSANLIIIYDYLITFGAEVDQIWASKRKTNFATIIFFVNRYNMLIQATFWVAEYFVQWSSIKVSDLHNLCSFYFGLLFAINSTQMVLSVTNTFKTLTYFIMSLSSIIISRLILDIREVPLKRGTYIMSTLRRTQQTVPPDLQPSVTDGEMPTSESA